MYSIKGTCMLSLGVPQLCRISFETLLKDTLPYDERFCHSIFILPKCNVQEAHLLEPEVCRPELESYNGLAEKRKSASTVAVQRSPDSLVGT